MFSSNFIKTSKPNSEAEKPFWISYADMMSALMVLFLVVMVVALISITQVVKKTESDEVDRETAIRVFCNKLEKEAKKIDPTITVNNRGGCSVNFGPKAYFKSDKHTISFEGQELLRRFTPKLLRIGNSEEGRKWFKRVLVTGFTDRTGSYLYNLGLSLKRAERVVCILMGTPDKASRFNLTIVERKLVRNLFTVGGYSFNSAKETDAASRRVEFQIEFWPLARNVDDLNETKDVNLGNLTLRQAELPKNNVPPIKDWRVVSVLPNPSGLAKVKDTPPRFIENEYKCEIMGEADPRCAETTKRAEKKTLVVADLREKLNWKAVPKTNFNEKPNLSAIPTNLNFGRCSL